MDSVPWNEIAKIIGYVATGTAALLGIVFHHQREIQKIVADREARENGTNGATERSLRELIEANRETMRALRDHVQFTRLTYKPDEWDGLVRGVNRIESLALDTRRMLSKVIDRGVDLPSD